MGNQSAHLSWFSAVNNQRYCWRSWFICSVCPSVCGWCTVDNLGVMPRHLHKSFMTCDVNWGPRSDTIEHGSLWFFHMLNRYSFVVSSAVTIFVVGMNSISFENWSTTTKIESYLLDIGRSMVKSAVMSTHSLWGTSSGLRVPNGAWFVPLNLAHLSHLSQLCWHKHVSVMMRSNVGVSMLMMI